MYQYQATGRQKMWIEVIQPENFDHKELNEVNRSPINEPASDSRLQFFTETFYYIQAEYSLEQGQRAVEPGCNYSGKNCRYHGVRNNSVNYMSQILLKKDADTKILI